MEAIIVKTKGRRFLNAIFYAALGGLLFILPFFLLYQESDYLLWIFITEITLLIGLYNYKADGEDILKDIFYLRYYSRNSRYRISEKLKNLIDEDHAIPGKMVDLGSDNTKRLGTIVKLLADDPKADIEEYNGGRISFDKNHFKLLFSREASGIILCIFQDISKEAKNVNDLRKANDEARSLAILHGSLLRHLPVAIVARNMSMDIVYYNQQYYDLVIGPEGVFVHSDLDISPEYKKTAMEALGSDKIVVSERSMIIDDKKELFQITDFPDKDSGIVLSYMMNVKEEGRLKELVKDLRSGVASFLDSLDYACMVIDKEGYLKYYNSKLIEIWDMDVDLLSQGITHTEILDHLYLKGKLPAQSDYTKFKHDRLSMHGELRRTKEDFFYLPNGTCVRSTAVPFEENSILFTYEDVTQRLNVERSLRFANKVRDSIIEHSKEGVAIFDKDGSLDVINNNMLRIWNFPLDTDHATFTSDIFIEKSFAGLQESEMSKIQEAFTRALASNIEVEQVIKGADNKIVQRRISQLPNKSVMIVDQEVTEDFQKMESYLSEIKSLKSVDKDKTAFLANMPYKIRGAVNSLIGISHILLTQNVASLTSEQSSYLKDIKRSVDYISKVLDDTLDLSEFKSLYDMPSLADINLKEHIEEALKFLKEDFDTKKIKVEFTAIPKDTTCYTDGRVFENALISLLQNCIYRSKPSGSINVKLSVSGNKFTLKIEDNGVPNSLPKYSHIASNYYSLSMLYVRMMLDSLNIDFHTSYSPKNLLSTFRIELLNDRTFNQFDL